LRLVQREWQRFAHGREDFELGVADFDAAWRLRLDHRVAGHREHRLRQQPFQARELFSRIDDHLDRSAHIAEDEEIDAAEPAQCVQPPGQPDPLPGVRVDFRCINAFHEAPPARNRIRAPHPPRTRSALAVPP